MPVIRPRQDWHAATPRQELVDQLAQELTGEGSRPGLVIFEVPVKQNNTFHVIVVWEAWEGIPDDDRSSIILDAYRNSERATPTEAQKAPRITIAVGATAEEAIALDLLPFVLRPNVHRKNEAYGEIEQAMLQEGAIGQSPGQLELRFPTRQMAQEARDRLSSRRFGQLDDVYWQINETVGRIHDQ